MKIAVAVDSNKEGANVNPAFARAPYMFFYDTEKKEGTYVDNSGSFQTGGAGVKAAQMLADNGVEVLLAPKCGENAADVLKEAKIKVYKSVGNNLQLNIEAFLSGRLEEL